MSILSKWFEGMMEKDAAKFCYFFVDPSHTDVPSDAELITAGKHYFRVWVTEMYLEHSRRWFTEWYPAVHSLVRFRFGDEQVDIPNAIDPLTLGGVDTANADVVIRRDYAITALMPFRGGTVEIMAGLLAMKGRDYPQAFLGTVAEFARLLVVPELSAALQIAAPVALGIEKMVSSTNGGLHLGLHETLIGQPGVSNTLHAGYLVAIRAEEERADPNSFWIAKGQLRAGSDQATSKPYKAYDHIVFRIEKQTERDDWDSLSSIAGPWEEMVDALTSGDLAVATERKLVLLRAIRQCPDLTRDHKEALRKEAEKAFSLFRVAPSPAAAPVAVAAAGPPRSLAVAMRLARYPADTTPGAEPGSST